MSVKPLLSICMAALLLFSSCKKTVTAKQEDVLMTIIVSGVWIMESYVENGTVITPSFSGYEFKFERNGTVNGTVNGVSTSGTWSGSMATNSITSNFPGAGEPLNKLNGTWIITDSGLSFVKAITTTASGNHSLHLVKKS